MKKRSLIGAERLVARLVKALSDVEGLDAYRRMPGDSSEPYPFYEVRFLGSNATARRD